MRGYRRKGLPGVDPAYLDKEREELLRRNRQVLLFNDRELAALNEYCTRFKVRSKGAFMREAIMDKVLQALEENHPRLF